MLVQSYTIPPSSDYQLFLTAKRYWSHEFEENASSDPHAQTLIILHSTSFHKETWEPTLENLFELVASPGGGRLSIRDAWAIDCPNHGESGQLNHRALKEPEFANFSCVKYAEAVHRFLTVAPNDGPRVDFRRRNLVGIGHSLGANSMLILQHLRPVFTFQRLVIIEPMVSAEGRQPLAKLREALVANAKRRRDSWPSREEVKSAYSSRNHRSAKWDPRVVEAFLNHAIYLNPETNTFTLSCSREQEIAMYMDVEGPTRPVEDLNRVCHVVPTHLILGEAPDFIPSPVHQALINPNSGRRFASLSIMKNVGHLIPQELPTELASLIFEILASNPRTLASSRL